MSCQFCGALIDRGVVACPVCGGIQPEVATGGREVAAGRREVAAGEWDAGAEQGEAAGAIRRDPEQVVLAGPSCVAHPGTPVLGKCPRCRRDVCVRCAPEAVRDDLTCSECVGLTEKYRSPPEGALCAVHPATRAAYICSRCGSFACNACRPERDTSGLCARCAPQVLPLATRGSRLGASILDSFAVSVPIVGFAIVAGVLGGSGNGLNEAILIGGLAVGFVLGLGGQLVAQLAWGQSVGKRALGIKVVRSDGSPIELWRLIVMRNLIVQVLSQACFVMGLIDVLLIFGDQQRCLHDYLADSIVVQA